MITTICFGDHTWHSTLDDLTTISAYLGVLVSLADTLEICVAHGCRTCAIVSRYPLALATELYALLTDTLVLTDARVAKTLKRQLDYICAGPVIMDIYWRVVGILWVRTTNIVDKCMLFHSCLKTQHSVYYDSVSDSQLQLLHASTDVTLVDKLAFLARLYDMRDRPLSVHHWLPNTKSRDDVYAFFARHLAIDAIDWDTMMVGGGAVLLAVLPWVKDYNSSDIDIFCLQSPRRAINQTVLAHMDHDTHTLTSSRTHTVLTIERVGQKNIQFICTSWASIGDAMDTMRLSVSQAMWSPIHGTVATSKAMYQWYTQYADTRLISYDQVVKLQRKGFRTTTILSPDFDSAPPRGGRILVHNLQGFNLHFASFRLGCVY
jgi:hypothetical protein